MKLLELDIIQEVNQGIKYPEIPENYDGEICPYYLERKCSFMFSRTREKLESERNYFLSLGIENSIEEVEKELDYEDFKTCFQYCPTNFEKCLAYDIIIVGSAIPWDELFKDEK